MNIQEASEKIKKSKKYKNLPLDFISEKVKEYANKKKLKELEDVALKEIKSLLHKMHGSFRITKSKLSKHIKLRDYKQALKSNRSTQERLEEYEQIYQKIFEITGKPKSILDLGCGINPLSIPFMKLNLNLLEYVAYDINESEILVLNEFFKLENIHGKAEVLDLSKIESINALPSADACFMFKLVDILESKGHKYAEEAIQILIKKCDYVVVSFATHTLGGNKMKYAERGWIERMLSRVGLKFEKFEMSNEIFYIISKL